MSDKCVCGKDVVPFLGNENADILFLISFPSTPRVDLPGRGTMGAILRKEMAKEGISFNGCRRGYITGHKTKATMKECRDFWKEHCIAEGRDRKLIILVGADACKEYTEYKVSDVSGLIVDSPFFSAPVLPVIMPSAGTTIGETIFFVKQLKRFLDA